MNEYFASLKDLTELRRSVKKYEEFAMPETDLNEILTVAANAPSSWNLQHWRYLVVTSPEKKEKLLPIAYNQQQVVQASAVIVILGDLEANRSAETIFGEAVAEGFLDQKVYDVLLQQINGAYKNKQFAHDEAILNPSLSAMQLMLAAKAKGYDTCPMGGFDQQALIKELNIPERYIPVMLVVIGKAAQPGRFTSRMTLEQLIIRESF